MTSHSIRPFSWVVVAPISNRKSLRETNKCCSHGTEFPSKSVNQFFSIDIPGISRLIERRVLGSTALEDFSPQLRSNSRVADASNILNLPSLVIDIKFTIGVLKSYRLTFVSRQTAPLTHRIPQRQGSLQYCSWHRLIHLASTRRRIVGKP